MENEIKKSMDQISTLITKDRRVLQALKKVAVVIQSYELASNLRNIETELFPEAKTTNDEYKEAEKFKGCLNMTQVNTSTKMAYTILRVAKKFIELGGNYDIDTASKINYEANNVFGE